MDKPFQPRELTVREVRRWFADVQHETEIDAIGEMLVEDCSLADLARMSNYTRDDLDECTPSQIQDLVRQVKEANRAFFRFRAQLLDAGARARQLLDGAAPPAPAPPAPTSETSTPSSAH